MRQRRLVLILLVGLLAPAAAGALSPDMDPNGLTATSTGPAAGGTTELSPDMDPNGLATPAPTGAFGWLEQLVSQLLTWVT